MEQGCHLILLCTSTHPSAKHQDLSLTEGIPHSVFVVYLKRHQSYRKAGRLPSSETTVLVGLGRRGIDTSSSISAP